MDAVDRSANMFALIITTQYQYVKMNTGTPEKKV